VKGKGIVSLSKGKRKAQDVLLVENLKHNLLSVSQVSVCILCVTDGL
jgi:hypothetical protein